MNKKESGEKNTEEWTQMNVKIRAFYEERTTEENQKLLDRLNQICLKCT